MPRTRLTADPQPDHDPARGTGPIRFLVSGLLFAALWFTLVGPEDRASWIIGLPTVIAAAWIHLRLSRPYGYRLSLLGGARLVPFFLFGSLTGGIDVARRVVGPRVDVDPGFLDYELRLAPISARVLFADLVSLMPGTLSVDLEGDRVQIHALDQGALSLRELARLEQAVAALFGAELADAAGASS